MCLIGGVWMLRNTFCWHEHDVWFLQPSALPPESQTSCSIKHDVWINVVWVKTIVESTTCLDNTESPFKVDELCWLKHDVWRWKSSDGGWACLVVWTVTVEIWTRHPPEWQLEASEMSRLVCSHLWKGDARYKRGVIRLGPTSASSFISCLSSKRVKGGSLEGIAHSRVAITIPPCPHNSIRWREASTCHIR